MTSATGSFVLPGQIDVSRTKSSRNAKLKRTSKNAIILKANQQEGGSTRTNQHEGSPGSSNQHKGSSGASNQHETSPKSSNQSTASTRSMTGDDEHHEALDRNMSELRSLVYRLDTAVGRMFIAESLDSINETRRRFRRKRPKSLDAYNGNLAERILKRRELLRGNLHQSIQTEASSSPSLSTSPSSVSNASCLASTSKEHLSPTPSTNGSSFLKSISKHRRLIRSRSVSPIPQSVGHTTSPEDSTSDRELTGELTGELTNEPTSELTDDCAHNQGLASDGTELEDLEDFGMEISSFEKETTKL